VQGRRVSNGERGRENGSFTAEEGSPLPFGIYNKGVKETVGFLKKPAQAGFFVRDSSIPPRQTRANRRNGSKMPRKILTKAVIKALIFCSLTSERRRCYSRHMPTNLQPLFDKLASLDQDIASLREEAREFKERVYSLFDAQTAMLIRIEQEHTALTATVRRLQDQMEGQGADIKWIKNEIRRIQQHPSLA